MATTPRVVIVGAGIVGAALADELSARGVSTVTVLDKGPVPVTGGSSSHAPGLVFRTNPCRTMTALARYTVDKYAALPGDCFRAVGGLELATTPERLADLHRRAGLAAASGIDGRIVDAHRCAQLWPGLDVDRVLGGFWTPGDGLADAVACVREQLAAAVARGAEVRERTAVLGIEQRGGRVTGVRTTDGVLPADVVISAAGLWGPAIGALAGVAVPLLPMAHQYVRTAPAPGVHPDLPILRHQDRDLYYRAYADTTMGIGSYAHDPMPVDLDALGDGPAMLAFTPDDFAPSWRDTVELLPALAGPAPADGFNGVFSFTPDGAPLLGETPELAGFWLAEAVWVTHSAGVARAVAEWIVDGEPSIPVHGCDVRRFEGVQRDPGWVAERSARQFVEVYDVIHPHDPPAVARPVRRSPVHDRHAALGAEFGEVGGWERPLWYASTPLADVVQPERTGWAARNWDPRVTVEAAALRARGAVVDMTPLRRVDVMGPGAVELVAGLATGSVWRAPGAVGYCLLLGPTGGVRSDVTVARVTGEHLRLGVNTAADVAHLAAHAPEGTAVVDVTEATCCLGLWGPRARDVLAPLVTEADRLAGLRYFRCAELTVAGVAVLAVQVSYAGELGWELTCAAGDGPALFDALLAAGDRHGVVPVGRRALDVLRIEKGYRSWGTDVDATDAPAEAGLDWAIHRDSTAVGIDAARARPVRNVLCTLTLDDPAAVLLGNEPVFVDGVAAGHVTSAAWSPHRGRTVALARLPVEAAVAGTAVAVQWFGEKRPATVVAAPAAALIDPDMTRPRA